jgi:ubiquinone biosynthesis protein Coq4
MECGKKEFDLTHDPWHATGGFERELLHLIDLGAKDFVQIGNGLWKVIR